MVAIYLAGLVSKAQTGRGRRYLFITACTALQADLTIVVVTSPEARLQVTREKLLIKAIGKPGRRAAFPLARTMLL